MTTAPDLTMDLSAECGRDAVAALQGRFDEIAAMFAAPLTRLARAHEADLSQRQDLLQEMHLALWRSLPSFENRSNLRTWVFRVA